MHSTAPDGLVAYSAIMLSDGEYYLLLHRAASKAFMPDKWTGIGGLVEPHEHETLRASALRELHEEAGIGASEVRHFVLRRALLHARPGGPLTLLLYFTGEWRGDAPSCTEGVLQWVRREQFAQLDVIDTTHPVLPLLADDMQRDPDGTSGVVIGVASHLPDGVQIAWSVPHAMQ